MNKHRNHCFGPDLPLSAFTRNAGRLATLEGGGSGGSSNPDTRYANLDNLYGVQTQASQYMLDNAMPQIPGLTSNSANMVNDAMDGTLAKQMREQAGNNATATMGSALAANERSMQRYGMGMNANRLQSENNRNAIMGAANKSGEMNKANVAAEDMKWNRNANFYGQVMGMNNGAMSSMSSATAGMSGLASQQSAAEQKNAAGFGAAGSAFGSSLMKADGGYIEGEKAVRLADGGDAWEKYKAANPVKPMSSSGGKRTNPIAAAFAGASPHLMAAGVKDIMKGSDGALLKGGKSAVEYVKNADQLTNGAKSIEQAKEFSSAAEASKEAGYTGAEAFAGPVESAPIYGSDAVDTTYASDIVSAQNAGFSEAGSSAATEAGGQAATELATSTSTGAAASVATEPVLDGFTAADYSWLMSSYSKGGEVKNPRLKFALGGMPTMQQMSVSDNASVATNDTSGNMAPASMDVSNSMSVSNTASSPSKVTLAKSAGPVSGETKDPTEQAVKGTVARESAKAGVNAAAGAGAAEAGTGAGLASGTGAGVSATAGGTGAGMAAGTGAGITTGTGAGVAAGAGSGVVAGSAAGAGTGVVAGTGAGLAAGTGAGITAGAGAGVAAGVGSGAAAGAAAGSVVPVVGTAIGAIAGIIASQYFADGGDVQAQTANRNMVRKDYTKGTAEVTGPGTETSDDIPSWLEPGSYVLNAEAAKMVSPEAIDAANNAAKDKLVPAWLSTKEAVLNPAAVKAIGKDKLEAINKAGLKVRYGAKMPEQAGADTAKPNGYELGGEISNFGKKVDENGDPLTGKVLQQDVRNVENISNWLGYANGGMACKRGVKLAGGGFLGGNLGIAMGAGVDQWNRQQQIDQHQQAIDLQKSTDARQNEEMGWKRAEWDKAKKNEETIARGADIGSDAISVAGGLADLSRRASDPNGNISKAEYDAAVKAYFDSGYSPSALADRAGAEVGKVDMAKGLAYRGAVKNAAFEPVAADAIKGGANSKQLAGLMADIDPVKAIGMVAKDEASDAKLAQMLHLQELKNQAYIDRAMGGRGVGGASGSRSGSGGEKQTEDEKRGREMVGNIFGKEAAFTIGAGETARQITGPEIMPLANQHYSELTRRENGIPHDMAARYAAGLAKSQYGISGAEYSAVPDIDVATGKPVVQVVNSATGRPETTLYGNGAKTPNGIGNIHDFMTGTKEQKEKNWADARSNAAVKFFGTPEDTRRAASMSPTDIANMVNSVAEANPNIPRRDIEAKTMNYIGHAKEYARLNPETSGKKTEYENVFEEFARRPMGQQLGSVLKAPMRGLQYLSDRNKNEPDFSIR